jgi:hypothetical protein
MLTVPFLFHILREVPASRTGQKEKASRLERSGTIFAYV